MDRTNQLRNSRAGAITLSCAFTLLPALGLASFSVAGFSYDIGSSMEGVLRWESAVRRMESALPVLRHDAMLVVYYWLAVLAPMCIFRRMHPLIASTLRASSLFVGLVCWWQAFIVTYRLLGWLCVVTGLFFGGVGIVPLALFATAGRGDWDVFGNILATAALTLVARSVAKTITKRRLRKQLPGKPNTYWIDDYNA